ncbi:hypothetical protein DYL59_14590 [Pseudomonas kairouanensis]|uniref:Uncharacterized protein n=1 Tax=Pseudomonas kairouanensis TaxID=2293832 RepID=A0A4Z0AR53_9PSED|nr:hypothetical protein [Pseudomonas kairouanensis]TFY88614.1 hypothetical protein DYL59_14590 [Pseudomonas kairouanensis]
MHDQAAGLRQWAQTNRRTLMLLGSEQEAVLAHMALERWHRQGQRWVGDPTRWRVQAVDKYHSDLAQSRWGIWLGSDLDAFRRAFNTLSVLRDSGGPTQVLALHAGLPREGLLNNLHEAAQRYLAMRLLLINEPPL